MEYELSSMRSSVEEGVDRRVAGEKNLGEPNERTPTKPEAQILIADSVISLIGPDAIPFIPEPNLTRQIRYHSREVQDQVVIATQLERMINK